MIRLFAAIAIPEAIGEGLASRQRGLPGARWSALDNLHITLRYFGEMPENRADDLDSELSVIGGGSLELSLSGVGTFGDNLEIDAVWAGVAEDPALRRLAGRCESAARRAGLAADARAWRPHVTLAYLSAAEPVRVAAWVRSHNLLKSPPFRIDAFGLYSSWRGETGSSYRLERAYPLF